MSDLLSSAGLWFRRHPGIRAAAKPLIERVVTLAERRRGFRTMPGSFLPYRVEMLRGTYEPAETRFLSARAGSARLILDVGANIGYFARCMAAYAPSSSVIVACEPNPLLTATLVGNVAAFKNVRVFPCGLSDTPQPRTLHMPDSEYAVASVEPAVAALHAHGGRSRMREIPCLFTTGRLLLESVGLGVPDLMKIDVEGWELPALRGFGPLVSEARIGTILFEVNPAAQRAAGQEAMGVICFLREAGYTISRLSEEGALLAMNAGEGEEMVRALGDGGFASLVATSGVSRG